MTYPRYPAYKESGVPWLGQVPAHWDSRELRRVADVRPSNIDKLTVEGQRPVQLCNYMDAYKNEKITDRLVFMPASASDEQIRRLTLRRDDVIITKDSETPDDIGVAALVEQELESVVCGYHLALLRPEREVMHGPYLFRSLQSSFCRAQFSVSAVGMTRYGLSLDDVKSVVVPVPPPAEQGAIAAYLDRETAQIDALVARLEQLVALLQEKRQALISHAVTKGLDPSAPMKPSGVKWLGEVPAHWEVRPLKGVADIQTGVAKGRNLEGRKTVAVSYLRVANVQDGYLDLDDVATIEILESEVERYRLKYGDVLMNEGGDNDKLGRGHIWHGEVEPCIHQNHVFAVRAHGFESEWLTTITGSDYAKSFFEQRAKQTTNLASISARNLSLLPVVLPPETERHAIMEWIRAEGARIGLLVESTVASTALLRERRAALITAAVTGQIDVRRLM